MPLSFQIGNAVPPLMARAIGREMKKCLVWKMNKENEAKAVKSDGAEAKQEEIVVEDDDNDAELIE